MGEIMWIWFLVFFFFLLCLFIISLLMLWRNDVVHKYRISLINLIHEQAKRDIDQDLSRRWRYKVFYSITYDTMLYKFWRRMDSFYSDKSFLEPQVKKDLKK